MSQEMQITLDTINKMDTMEIIKHEMVRARFINIHDALWGNGLAAYERESIHFNRILADKPELQKATKFSVFTAFIDLAVCGLSLEKQGAKALCYLQGRNYQVGVDPQTGKKVYEGRIVLTISGYGELVLRSRCGQIRYADNPVLVYEEDKFSYSDENGQKQVKYTCNLPHTSNHIVACYLRITRADNSVDYGVMFEEDWLRLKEFSEKNNRRWNAKTNRYEENANELYTSRDGSIDTGFLKAKCIKHAFSTYPKVRIGNATILESQETDIPENEDYYGIQGQPAAEEQPAMQKKETFVPETPASEGVVIDPAASEGKAEDDDTF